MLPKYNILDIMYITNLNRIFKSVLNTPKFWNMLETNSNVIT